MPSENGNMRSRERYVTCSEETLESMERYLDDKFENNMSSESSGTKSTQSQNKTVTKNTNSNSNKGSHRPTIKTSKKDLLKNNHKNRNKTFGFVPRVLRRVTIQERNSSPIRKRKESTLTEILDERLNAEGRSPPAKVQRYENKKSDKEASENNNIADTSKTNEDEWIEVEDEFFPNENNNEKAEIHAPNKVCIDCNKMYVDKNNDKSKRTCRICKCFEHGCLQTGNNAASKGDIWLCGECMKLTDIIERKHPDLFENLRLTLQRKETDRKNSFINQKQKLPNKETKKSIPLLSYLDIVFNDEDYQSLKEGKWISDSVIAFWFKYLEDVVYKDNSNILFIPPSIAQALKESLTEDFNMILDPLNISEKKWILLAVNNNKADVAGGEHWSLLVYAVKENLWYHYDSLNNINLGDACILAKRVQQYIKPGSTPNISAALCTKQDNNIDCGAHTMINAEILASALDKSSLSNMEIPPYTISKEDITSMRNKIRGMIATIPENTKTKDKDALAPKDFDGFKDKPIKDNQNPPIQQPLQYLKDANNKSDNTKLDLKNVRKYPNINRDKICLFLTRGNCRYGAKGENNLGKCNKYHPNQCKDYNINGTTANGCKKGNECTNWHATYICRLSANSNICNRINCNFKHHKNCSVTRNNEKDFLAKEHDHRMYKQYQSPEISLPNRNQHQQQHYQHHQRQQHQELQVNMQQQWPHYNQMHPPHQQQYNRPPHVSEDHLRYLIRSIMQQEKNNYY